MGEVRQVERFSHRIRNGRGNITFDMRASGEGKREYETLTCIHCNRVVILNPERKRNRNRCTKCHAYVCDSIECNLSCTPVTAIMEMSLKATDLSPFATDPLSLFNKEQAMQKTRVY